MKMDLDISIKLEQEKITLINHIYKSLKLFPNYHMIIRHIWMDLLLVYYSYIIHTIQVEVEQAN